MVEEDNKNLILNVSDPTHKLTTATVKVAGAGLKYAEGDKEISVTGNGQGVEMKLSLEGSRGKTYSVKLSK